MSGRRAGALRPGTAIPKIRAVDAVRGPGRGTGHIRFRLVRPAIERWLADRRGFPTAIRVGGRPALSTSRRLGPTVSIDTLDWAGIAPYKLAIAMFNLVPYVATHPA